MADNKDKLQEIVSLKKVYLSTFESESGKQVLADLAKRCFTKTTTFSDDALRLAFNEGQRTVLLTINNMMNLDVEKMKNLIEQQKKESNDV